jgi:beta-phosphoglucomutase-like phosphatase (HAD superfamily)
MPTVWPQVMLRCAPAWPLMAECRAQGVRQAITTTTSRSNVEALLKTAFGGGWAEPFDAVVCGEDVRCKKPDPEVFLLALQRLQIGPLDAIAIEDSPGGVAAARAAQVPVLVTGAATFSRPRSRLRWRSGRGGPASRLAPGARVGPGRVTLDDLLQWRERADSVSQHA